MASLSNILQAKGTTFYKDFPGADPADFGLPGNNVDNYDSIDVYGVCGTSGTAPTVNYTASASGKLVIDVWGSSGSTGRTCCCGIGIPGNSGAFSRKIIDVQVGDTVTGSVGVAVGNETLNYPGIGTASCITINTAANGCECICAEPGFGGYSACIPSTAPYNCFASLGYCNTNIGASCGIVCNLAGPQSAVAAQAYGGSLNLDGGISVTCFFCSGMSTATTCARHQRIPISPGIISIGTSYVEVTNNAGNSQNETSSNSAYNEMMAALTGLSRSFSSFYKHNTCWTGGKWCGCYENLACQSLMPVGVPAPGMVVSDGSTRDSGVRGGHGMVKIKFIGS